MAGSGFFPTPDFIEREPWERGFGQIFANDIAPRLAALERRRWLVIALIPIAAVVALLLFHIDQDIPVDVFGLLPISGGGLLFLITAGAAVQFRRQEEALFLPAVCRQFGGLTVKITPVGRRPTPALLQPYWEALQPYWDLDLVARPSRQGSRQLDVRELFAAERSGIAVSLLAIDVGATKGRMVERVFFGDLLTLTLPELGSGAEYAAGRFEAAHAGNAEMSAGSHDLRTPEVMQALAQFCDASGAPQALGAVSGNRLYLAAPFSKQARRTGRLGLWRRVYRCESAIRLALAQLNAALHLTEAVAEACARPASPASRGEGSVAVSVPSPPAPKIPWPLAALVVAAGIAFFAVLLALGWW
jgi:hypothetical protein